MTYRIVTAGPGIRACDHLGEVSLDQATALADDKFGAIGLYPQACSKETLLNCTARGLGVWWILEGLRESTIGSQAMGRAMAEAAIEKVRSWGVPIGDTYFGDLEGTGRPVQSWIDLSDGQSSTILAAQSIPGAYMGFGTGLSSQQSYDLRAVRYWDSRSLVPEPACGWSVIQGPTDYHHEASGLLIDFDWLIPDRTGRSVSLVVSG